MVCDNCNKNCCFFGIIATGSIALLFHIILVSILDLSLKKEGTIRNRILYETPIYDLDFSPSKPEDKNIKYVRSFYDFQGRDRKEYDSTKDEYKTVLIVKRKIARIYGYYFVYKKDERTYFDYLQNYTVDYGENCKDNYKKCGIFNVEGKILCLPDEEDCPLNGFAISQNPYDTQYINAGYNKFKVKDNSTNTDYYFYYTNNNINDNIITTFNLSNGFPCMNSSQRSWISVFNDEHEPNPTCKSKRDNRYTLIPGNITLKSLYSCNNITIKKADSSKINSEVNLYTRNFIDKNQDCITKFFSDVEEENNSYHNIEKAIRIINILCIMAIFFIILYSSMMCCCCRGWKYHWPFLIIHAYGIIIDILSMVIIYRDNLEYKCDNDSGFNTLINDIVNDSYKDSRSSVIALGVLSIFTLILNLIFSICLILNKNKNNNYGTNNIVYGYPPGIPAPVAVITPQTIYVQQAPINNNIGYATPYNYDNYDNYDKPKKIE